MIWSLLNSLLLTLFRTDRYAVSQPNVQLGDTTLIGISLQPSNLEFFGGIPYVEPPVDGLRFSPPQLKYSLSPLRSFDASHFGNPCPQPQWHPNMSEDCLTLNVFRPSGVDAGASLPVMLWIHGGGFLNGASSLYDGSPLVKRSVDRGTPILFVSINYRIGPLGFPQGPEAVKRGVLNLGLQDQRTALQWVQNNIASFGGDPDKVTVFGQSAGAASTSYHWINDDFSTVARAAIFESGSASGLSAFYPSRNFPAWAFFVNSTQACTRASPNNTFACLRSVSEPGILAAINATLANYAGPFLPVLDGPGGLLSDYPAKRLSCGAGGRVPLLIGNVLDEGTFFTPLNFPSVDIPIWLVANATPSPAGPDALKAAVDKVLSLYPDDPSAGSPFGTGNQTFGAGSGYKREAALFGDMHFHAIRRFWTRTTSAPSYAYLFTDPQPNADPAAGIFHTAELRYLFGDLSTSGPPKVATFARTMMDYWISFAVSLTPNDDKGTNRPQWGTYGGTKKLLELNSNSIHMIPDTYRATSIDFLIRLREILSW